MLIHVLHRQGGDQAETFTQLSLKEARLTNIYILDCIKEVVKKSNQFDNLNDQQVEADELTIVNYCPFRDAPVNKHQTFKYFKVLPKRKSFK